ncbi:IS110 family transposase [Arthrobacter sp. NicSoilB8]|uniref:IS110 family transposase n=1 Tax=Arthrobacter sp. NicSoilB8 TaxID=2830998 RepID=UPI001CC6C9BD|nr:IS110 family transposase [Arthrobacter sp. NicSoilB8]BCW72433.1 IS110 family transposase [Arthrobacter sp. NicSoilB8]BCW73119.1 IS110 family transposase [Arthrobacter sp. NicSoilB8]
MTIVAEKYTHVIGVDTHSRTHTYAILASATGQVIDTSTFPASQAGISRAISWMQRRTTGEVLVSVEGTGSYGAGLTRALRAAGLPVCEARPPKRQDRGAIGKSDAIDARAAARAVLGTDTAALIQPRAEGARDALRVLLAARRSMDGQRTADRHALTALARTTDLGIDARKPITDRQLHTIAAWRDRPTDGISTKVARSEARRLATAVLRHTSALETNRADLAQLVDRMAPGLQDLRGLGPVTGAIILTAYSHPGRIRSEAAFAALAGVSPIPASSGNTTRHRLNRHGDRQLNQALDIIARTRMASDAATRAYLDRRTQEGKTRREIRRCLKRIIARQIYRKLTTLMA